MASNFDKNFEHQKSSFQEKFGIEWNEDKQLYLSYLQTLYIAQLAEVANNGFGELSSKQKEIHHLLQGISQNLVKGE